MSNAAPYTIITSDAHAGASIATYRDYLDKKHQDLFDEWRGTYKNPQKKHIGSKKHKNWDDDERIGDMDSEARERLWVQRVRLLENLVLVRGASPDRLL